MPAEFAQRRVPPRVFVAFCVECQWESDVTEDGHLTEMKMAIHNREHHA